MPFRPYRTGTVTVEEWENYRSLVEAAFAKTMKVRPAFHEVEYFDMATGTQYIFTTQGHAAHPAWLARRIGSWGGADYVDQVGGCAGSWKPYWAWFEMYKRLPPAAARGSGNAR